MKAAATVKPTTTTVSVKKKQAKKLCDVCQKFFYPALVSKKLRTIGYG